MICDYLHIGVGRMDPLISNSRLRQRPSHIEENQVSLMTIQQLRRR